MKINQKQAIEFINQELDTKKHLLTVLSYVNDDDCKHKQLLDEAIGRTMTEIENAVVRLIAFSCLELELTLKQVQSETIISIRILADHEVSILVSPYVNHEVSYEEYTVSEFIEKIKSGEIKL